MKLPVYTTLAALALRAHGHTTVTAAWVNDVDQGQACSNGGTGSSIFYSRCTPTNNPIKDLTSSTMSCNVNPAEASKYIQVKAGDKFTFEWHHNSRSATDDIIAVSHKGPVNVFIAPAASNGSGNVWVKLFQDAGTTSYWGVDKLIAAKGKHYIYIPDIAPGKYLLRPELITLHEANVAYKDNPLRGVQLYFECIQVEVTSSGTTTLPEGVSFPGAYSYSDPGIVYDLYRKAGLLPYTVPGPAVWSDYTKGGGFGS